MSLSEFENEGYVIFFKGFGGDYKWISSKVCES